MKYYLINPTTLTVLLFTSIAGASSVAEAGDIITPAGEGAKLTEVPTPLLLKLRNEAARIGEGKEIKGFRDRESALKATLPVLEFLAKPGTARASEESTTPEGTSAPEGTDSTESAQGAQENDVATKRQKGARKGAAKGARKGATKKAATKRVAGEGGGQRGRASRFAGMVITRQQKENPRREGTRAAKAWDLIRDGMTYEQYMEKGGNLEDITREWERKRVKISKK